MTKSLGWAEPAQGLTGATVQLGGDEVEVLGAVDAEVGAFGKVLTEQSVGVFVGAPLPWAGGVAEVDVDPGGDLDVEVVAHLDALVPGERLPGQGRQLLNGGDHGPLDLQGAVTAGQVEEKDKAARAFDQGADGGLAFLTQNEV